MGQASRRVVGVYDGTELHRMRCHLSILRVQSVYFQKRALADWRFDHAARIRRLGFACCFVSQRYFSAEVAMVFSTESTSAS